MENSNPILAELRTVSPTMAEIPRKHPFVVPRGYFQDLADQVLALIKDPEYRVLRAGLVTPYTVEFGYFTDLPDKVLLVVKGDPVLQFPGISTNTPFSVPAGYFDSLPEAIVNLIREELPSVLQGPRDNPYRAPAGYFDAFPFLVLNKIKIEEAGEVFGPKKPSLFEVPQGYFEGFAQKMLERVKEDELPAVLSDLKGNVYSAPEGYFESFPSTQLELAKNRVSGSDEEGSAAAEIAELSPVLKELFKDRKMPFSVPEGYFTDQDHQSTILAGMSKQNVYDVPGGYFENLPGEIVARVIKTEPAKVVTGSFGRSWIKYAAAAVVIGTLITSAFFIFQQNDRGTEVAGAPGVAIDILKKLDQTSDDAIFNYLDDQNLSYVDPAATSADEELDQEAIRTLLADVSDAAIEAYLDQETDNRKPLTN